MKFYRQLFFFFLSSIPAHEVDFLLLILSGSVLNMAERFVPVSNQEVVAGSTPAATTAATKGWVEVFRCFNAAQESPLDEKVCSQEDLCISLSKLYVGAKRVDGAPYQRSSMLCLRAEIARHFGDLRRWDIVKDAAFRASNKAIDAVLKKNKSEGHLRPVQHKDFICDADFGKRLDLFMRSKEPDGLNQQVWFFISLHFSLRGRELQRSIKKSDLVLREDENKKECFEMAVDLATKTSTMPQRLGEFKTVTKCFPSNFCWSV